MSHNQGELLLQIFEDLARLCSKVPIEVFLTKNVPEVLPFDTSIFTFPVVVIENLNPKGFGANHNAAFHHAKGEWFCVMNPDVSLLENPFPTLLEEATLRKPAVIAPVVLDVTGKIEDSIRYFPKLSGLLVKLFGQDNSPYPVSLGEESFVADWVAGMFMLFRSEDFWVVDGFDENFFLYYEDVDICARLWKGGRAVLACPKVQIVHDARRASRTDFRYMKWHMVSMARYFWKYLGHSPRKFVS